MGTPLVFFHREFQGLDYGSVVFDDKKGAEIALDEISNPERQKGRRIIMKGSFKWNDSLKKINNRMEYCRRSTILLSNLYIT